jgi:Tol biopolymer transport system component
MSTQQHTPSPQARSATLVARRWPYLILALSLGALIMMDARGLLAQQEALCFPETTGYCISGRIREFWEENGGLPVFGYPITPQREEVIEDQVLQVQWFERERLELHPENARPYDVLLGRLGADRLEQQERNWRDFPDNTARDGCRFFPETQQNVCGEFLEAWRADGLEIDGQPGKTEIENLALFGLPLSPPQRETIEGQEYIVQWFERARFESHPENDPPYNVLFGLLGNEVRDFERTAPLPTATPDPDATPTPTATPEPDDSNERIAFASDREGDREIFVMYPDGTDVVNLTDDPGIDGVPAISPDGTQIAFASERDGNREIYVMDIDGSNQRRLTDNRDDDWGPAWSPDGWRIAFESDRDGNREIYVMSSVDGSRQSNLTNSDAEEWDPTWSPDGEKIAFQTDREGYYHQIYTMNDDGTRQRNLTDHDSRNRTPAWSPDGEQIAFESDRDGNWDIYVMEADGSDPVRLTTDSARDEDPAWSPDGSQIAFRSERDGNGEIYVMEADGSGETNLTRHRANDRDPNWGIIQPEEDEE